ncbi:MAG: helicase-related protein, partial [Deltaproteobacteria bacterium]|nr:helicase-related protein [Deltaproteobacteria bacterium]
KVVKKGGRVLATTLTNRMSENLTKYYEEKGVRVRYLHSDIETLERIEIIRELRLGSFDVLVGINLLREGLDIPEVALVAILDADKEGFLRSERSLIQTFGRAARNVEGRVICYADRMTGSLERAIAETNRRRERQAEYNKVHHITPVSITKEIRDSLYAASEADYVTVPVPKRTEMDVPLAEIPRVITALGKEMARKAKNMEFEEAGRIRDEIKRLKVLELEYGIKS